MRVRAAVVCSCLLLAGACAESEPTEPLEAAPVAAPEAAVLSGIVFSSAFMTVAQVNTVHTGLVYGPTPSNILSFLSQLRSKGGRVLIKLSGGTSSYKNADGTFNLEKWKTQVDRFRNIDFSSYIADGTIVGHYLVDEPNYPGRWGDQVISQATIEAAAKHSKRRWPTLATIVNAPPAWLASSTVTYVHLDAGWAMFRAKTASSPSDWINQQTKRAQGKGLGLVAGLNVLDGGDGSSGIRGTQPRTWAMSAAELDRYGSAMLAQSYVCAFSMWRYSAEYYDRSDVKNVMSSLSTKAKNHARTSCRQ